MKVCSNKMLGGTRLEIHSIVDDTRGCTTVTVEEIPVYNSNDKKYSCLAIKIDQDVKSGRLIVKNTKGVKYDTQR